MKFNLDIINIATIFIMFINSAYGFIVYFCNRNRVNRSFLILTITISAWGLSMFGYRGFLNSDDVLLMSRLLYFSAVTIPVAFIYFIGIFTNPESKMSHAKKIAVFLVPTMLCVLSLYPGGFIYGIRLHPGTETFIVFNSLTHIIFGLYVVSYFSWAYWMLYRKYLNAEPKLKKQLTCIFIGTLGSTAITLVTNLGLLYVGYFDLNWAGQIGIIFMITLIFYSIFKFELFNIKVIAVQLITFCLWLFMFMRIIFARDFHEALVESGLFVIVVILGALLLQNILQGIRQRNEISQLTESLKKAYAEIDKIRTIFEQNP